MRSVMPASSPDVSVPGGWRPDACSCCVHGCSRYACSAREIVGQPPVKQNVHEAAYWFTSHVDSSWALPTALPLPCHSLQPQPQLVDPVPSGSADALSSAPEGRGRDVRAADVAADDVDDLLMMDGNIIDIGDDAEAGDEGEA